MIVSNTVVCGDAGAVSSKSVRRTSSAAMRQRCSVAECNALVQEAIRVMEQTATRQGALLGDPATVIDYMRLRIGALPHEVFAVVFLDTQYCFLALEEMFRGTINHTVIHPREVVKAALLHNAAAVILAHNHPSGNVQPSSADEMLTQTLKAALALVDVHVLDHVIVSTKGGCSMASRGML